MKAEFYNIKPKLYLGLFSVKTLFMPSFALDASLRSSLGLLHRRKRAHCGGVAEMSTLLNNGYYVKVSTKGEGVKIPKFLSTWFVHAPNDVLKIHKILH